MLSAGESCGNCKVTLAKFIRAFPLKNLEVPTVLSLFMDSSISYWPSIVRSLGGIPGQLVPSLVHFLLHQLAFLICHAESVSCYSTQVISAGGLQRSKVIQVRRWVILYNSSIFSMEWYVTMYLLCSLVLIFCSGKALKVQGVVVKCEPIRPIQFYQCGYSHLLLWVICAIWFLSELLNMLGTNTKYMARLGSRLAQPHFLVDYYSEVAPAVIVAVGAILQVVRATFGCFPSASVYTVRVPFTGKDLHGNRISSSIN